MADDVPVCDVLCEAMEYLSKLGSNLRTRSEALKEKKINRDKLKNAHAVQKAANKVLLICQLSKKSLENVETGVNKILSTVGAAQSPTRVGGKSSNIDKPSTSKKADYQYFDYRSRKLKIAKKIPIKHYMSAKVLARSMPESMQNKYRVYYDCKLFRLRRRKALKESFKRRERPDSHSSKKDSSHEKGEFTLKPASIEEPTSNRSRSPEIGSPSKENKNTDRQSSFRRKDDDHHTSHKGEEQIVGSGSIETQIELKIVKDKNIRKSNPDFIEPENMKILVGASDNEDIADKRHRKVDKKLSKEDTTLKIDEEERDKNVEIEHYSKNLSKKIKDDDKRKNNSEKKSRDTNCVSVESENPTKLVKDSDTNDIAIIKHKSNNKSGDGEHKSNKKQKHRSDSNDSDTTSSKASCNIKSSSKEEIKNSDSDKQQKTCNERGKEESNEKRRECIEPFIQSNKKQENDKESTIELNKNDKDLNSVSSDSDSPKSSKKSEKNKSASRKEHRKESVRTQNVDEDVDKIEKHQKTEDGILISTESERKRDQPNKKRIDSKYDSSDSDSTKNLQSMKKHKDLKQTIRSHKRRKSIYLSSDTDDDLTKQIQEKTYKKFKKVKVIEDSDSSKEESNKTEENLNKKQVIDLDQDSDGDKEHKHEKPSTVPESEPQKPLLKLVNINKLLKPDILQKDKQLTKPPVNEPQKKQNEFGTESRESIKSSAMRSNIENNKGSQKFKKVRYEDEEKFWAPKRKEVEAFKPKTFTINIIRMTNMSKLLHEQNLRKITKCGSVICELNDKDSTQLNSKNGKGSPENEVTLSDIRTVKRALLVDSDSDKSESTPPKDLSLETENVKNTLLNDSDSENDDVQNTTAEKTTKSTGSNEKYGTVKNALLDQSDSERHDEQYSENVQATNAASKSKGNLKDYETVTLLDESDSEKRDDNSPAVTKHKNDYSKGGNDSDKSDSEKSDKQSKVLQRTTNKNNKQSKKSNKNETDSAKNSLLHDSDSEKKHEDYSDTDMQTKSKRNNCKGKKVCEDDSDSEQNHEVDNDKDLQGTKDIENSEYVKNDMHHDSEKNNERGDENLETATKKKDKKSNESDNNDETDNIKKTLLDDSDSEENNEKSSNKEKTTNNQDKNKYQDSKEDEDNRNIEKDRLDSNIEMVDDEDSGKLTQEDKCTSNEVDQTDNVKNNTLDDSDSEKNNDQDNSNLQIEGNESSKSKGSDEKDNISLKENLVYNSSITLSKHKDKENMVVVSNEHEKNSRTPDREISPTNEDADKVKSSLLNDSSDDSPKKPDKRGKRSGSTPQSKRKYIMESMHAKKMLLTYSSSSETDDEKLKNVLKEIKESLLKEISSDVEGSTKSHCRKLYTSSDSDEDILKRVKKKKKVRSNKSSEETREEVKENSTEETNDDVTMEQNNIDQIDGTMDETSNSSKMGRFREKRVGSSSHNSDNQDDKDVDGLTNLNTLNKSHQRSHSTKDKAGPSSKKTMKAAPLITGEGLLEAPSSSDEASAADSDALEEELPPVALTGLNGGAIEHLAKDDLLEDSDSSSSSEKDKDASANEKEDDEDIKQENESDTEENVKSKRRKAHAIASSDSEVGSSRPKPDRNASDFEDSEDEGSEPAKKKRKKKGSDSDASGKSSNEGSKKKRRRIKQIDDSDASGSDSENDNKKHGRKNIRKVMGKNQLEEATKKAAREEKERIARIADRQKMYNNLEFDESGKPDEVILDKVVLDFDPETKEPVIEVDRGLVKKLKPHQANGIKFMWDACFESVKRIKKDRGSGCILAHCMGLGKTLQVVSLTHALLTQSELTRVNRVLVVCPLSTVLNWVNEFRMWLKFAEKDYELDVYELSRYKQNSERAFQLSQWFEHGGVCVLGYEMFRNLSADNPKKFKKKMLRNFQESLVDPGPDMVVCDEGHLLKNEKTSLSQSMNRVKTHRRIVLTGTPLQNNLKEYYCMVQFVKPNLLGKYNEYLNRFVNPITNGQYTDSTEQDIRVMKRRSHVLHKMLDGAVQRRDYGVLAPFLPPKHEYVLFITLTEVQIKLYQHYLDNYSRRPLAGKSSGFLFPDFQSLQRIWTHPLVLKYNSERYEILQQKKRDKEEEDSEGSLADFIDDDSTPDDTSSEEMSDDSSDASDDSRKKKKKKAKKSKKESKASSRRATRANPVEHPEEEEVGDLSDVLEVKNENPTEWWIPMVTDDEVEDIRNSNKLVLLFEILRQCEAIGDKLLVFSQSLYSLDLIEHFLGKVDEATQDGRIDEKLGGHVGSWSPGVDYFRLDGSTSCENRSIWCKNFNREDNPRARLFLISTRAGGLGINLVAANRVIIFDVSWNPSHDVQSIFRVYRFGQKKPCYVYRFLVMGTMEEKIYERQVTKQAISKRVIDEQQIDRHYAENDLAELYKFEPRQPEPRPVPLVPKDRLFAEMLKEHEACIYKFHEHDSLLENKEEETLSEEERKAAWDDFENEKNKPPPAPFLNPWPMHNGMVPNLLAQQQQQLAYAALATMLRKDMPNLTDDQIRTMLPHIYGANPALMQKLGDIYKYPQPTMMNPAAAMMNSVMNAGGGALGGGGTSGLQYEPPWARDQQNLRLQQLLQQQNQMGAKFYAGGLGSRDPVAMALQQQRAREIMLGEQHARQRGRPPLAPRAPPTAAAPGDVVNLADSD